MAAETREIITILMEMYSFQECLHFLAIVRKFPQEQMVVLIDLGSQILYPIMKNFVNITLKPALVNVNPVLASRQAKLALYQESPFDKTIYMERLISKADAVTVHTSFLKGAFWRHVGSQWQGYFPIGALSV